MTQTPQMVRRDDFRPLADHRTIQVGTMWFDEPPEPGTHPRRGPEVPGADPA
ncbi:hypothetical protein ACIQVN_06650 [Streptomyces cyaneofuscatus]|uniref:hypothetical protein n=1 Tax=Streptomyces cyaneofuscatus TaxID=66883 RepID=UPI0037FA00AE